MRAGLHAHIGAAQLHAGLLTNSLLLLNWSGHELVPPTALHSGETCLFAGLRIAGASLLLLLCGVLAVSFRRHMALSHAIALAGVQGWLQG
jgi:hypothetical protein